MIARVAADRGLAVLLSSHRLEEIEAFHHNVLVLDRGRRLFWGDLRDAGQAVVGPRLRILFAAPDSARGAAARLQADDDITVTELAPPSLTVATRLRTGQVLERLNGYTADIMNISETEASLRDLLEVLFGRVDGV
jgi:ABC-2 type transport system ATP-binding protein